MRQKAEGRSIIAVTVALLLGVGKMAINSHRDLKIWQRSIDLVEEIYSITNTFPASELYGLSSQMRRAAVSVPSDIAEGFYRSSAKDYAHFLSMSKGSLMELDTQLIISGRLKYISRDRLDRASGEIVELERMIAVLRSRL